MVTTEEITVTCADGVKLHALLLIPEKPKAVVQFNGGTGAKKEFYQPFIEHLAQQGYLCCLWDYRGSGLSAPPSLKGCNYTFSDYGLKDMPAVKSYLRGRYPQLPFLVVGHSAGGQQWGFMQDHSDVKGLLGFGVSVGYAPYMPFAYRMQSHFFFYMFTPLSVLFTGYVAAKRFGIMEDLPKNVVREWRDWCAKPDYFFNPKFYGKTVPVGEFKNYPFPVHVVTAIDDTISNQRSVPAFWKHVESSKGITHQLITPQQYGVKAIDHFGFFKKNMKDTLWGEAVQVLDGFLE
jgi:predicted alpha/beta hydrolase